jgi:hypothetical protein
VLSSLEDLRTQFYMHLSSPLTRARCSFHLNMFHHRYLRITSYSPSHTQTCVKILKLMLIYILNYFPHHCFSTCFDRYGHHQVFRKYFRHWIQFRSVPSCMCPYVAVTFVVLGGSSSCRGQLLLCCCSFIQRRKCSSFRSTWWWPYRSVMWKII